MKRWNLALDILIVFVLASAFLWVAAADKVAVRSFQRWNGDAPPMEFRGPATAVVKFTTPEEVSRVCGKGLPALPVGLRIVACSWPTKFAEGAVLMPDPCAWADTEEYAKIQCHENAHLRGWVHD